MNVANPVPAKVCLVVEGCYPVTTGGISSWMDDLVAGLPDTCFSVARVGGLGRADQWAHAPTDNVVNLVGIAEATCIGPAGIRQWAEAHADALPDAAIYQAIGAGLAGELAREAAARRGAKFILCEHASYVEELAHGSMTLESGRHLGPEDAKEELLDTFRDLARRAYGAADIVTSLDARRRALQLDDGADLERTVTIPNGVRLAARAARLPTDPFTIAHIGRINPLKGTDVFLAAAAELLRASPRARAVVVGPWDCEGEYYARCQDLAAACGDRLTWLGPKPRHEWPDDISCVILPSRSEAQPLVALEAMARGIPVIGSAVGGLPDLIVGAGDACGDAGVVVGPDDSLTDTLRALMDDPTGLAEMGAAGRRRIETQYLLSGVLSAYDRLYNRLISVAG